MPSTQVSSATYLEAVGHRRTVYGINNKSPIPESRIQEIVNEAMLTLPSSFNSQSTRLLVVLGEQHEKFWITVMEASEGPIRQKKGEDGWRRSQSRLEGFRNGYGTIAFLEDQAAVKVMQEKFADFAHAFPQFSEHASAMHQITLWTALELEGFGASLQHHGATAYVDDAVKREFGLPTDWVSKAYLVFGGLAQDMPKRPDKRPLEETIKFLS